MSLVERILGEDVEDKQFCFSELGDYVINMQDHHKASEALKKGYSVTFSLKEDGKTLKYGGHWIDEKSKTILNGHILFGESKISHEVHENIAKQLNLGHQVTIQDDGVEGWLKVVGVKEIEASDIDIQAKLTGKFLDFLSGGGFYVKIESNQRFFQIVDERENIVFSLENICQLQDQL
jgi:hypothetical protein